MIRLRGIAASKSAGLRADASAATPRPRRPEPSRCPATRRSRTVRTIVASIPVDLEPLGPAGCSARSTRWRSATVRTRRPAASRWPCWLVRSPVARRPGPSGRRRTGRRPRCDPRPAGRAPTGPPSSRPAMVNRSSITGPPWADGPNQGRDSTAAGLRYWPMPFGPVDPALDLVSLEERVLARWREHDVTSRVAEARKDGEPWIFYEGPADGQRPPRSAPRVGPGVQGPVPALSDDAGSPRAPQGRLGLPWPAGRARDREGAGSPLQARDRELRHRRVQPEVPRLGAALRRGLDGADRRGPACGSTPRTRTGPCPTTTSNRCGGWSARCGTRASSTRVTASRPYCGRCGTALVLPRGRAGLPRRRRSVGLCPVPAHRRISRRWRTAPTAMPTCSSGRPRRGPSSPTSRPQSARPSSTSASPIRPAGVT